MGRVTQKLINANPRPSYQLHDQVFRFSCPKASPTLILSYGQVESSLSQIAERKYVCGQKPIVWQIK